MKTKDHLQNVTIPLIKAVGSGSLCPGMMQRKKSKQSKHRFRLDVPSHKETHKAEQHEPRFRLTVPSHNGAQKAKAA